MPATTGSEIDWGAIGSALFGAVAGANSGGGQGPQTTTSNLAPWQVPYVQQGLNAASQLFSQGPQQPYPNAGVAPLSQTTLGGIAGLASPSNVQAYQNIGSYLAGQATQPTQAPIVGAANVGEQQYIDRSLGGGYLNANPWLDKSYEQAARGVMSGVNSQFASGGRLNSGASQRALSGGLGDLATNLYGGAYEAERQRQQQTAQLAQGRSGQINQIAQGNQQAVQNAQNAGRGYGLQAADQAMDAQDAIMRAYAGQQAAGGTLDTQAQRMLNDQMQRYQQSQQAPWQNINQYLGAVTGNYGGTSQTQYQSNPWLGALGGAATGAGIYGSLFGGG
ncbi:hypothetical protein [Sphingomonas sp.]|jgi:hypothetical protein|uniref:hypothetical protein n=1 Tax=Sphingomonas sp. TaxID=28214 RepID=UPI00356B57A6